MIKDFRPDFYALIDFSWKTNQCNYDKHPV